MELYFAVVYDDKVEFCKGIDMLCELMLDGYFPIAFAESMQRVFDMMADYY